MEAKKPTEKAPARYAVHKFKLKPPANGVQSIEVPRGFILTHVDHQLDSFWAWGVRDVEQQETVRLNYLLISTGWETDFLGEIMYFRKDVRTIINGPFVWHFFEMLSRSEIK